MKASSGQSDKKLTMSTRRACKLLMSLTGILCLLGLPWIAIGEARTFLPGTVTNLVFTVYHSLQGFLLFIFLTAMNPELRSQWIKLLCRCWGKKKHSSLPEHTAPCTLVNLGEQCSPETNKRETEWQTHLTHSVHVPCLRWRVRYLLFINFLIPKLCDCVNHVV